MPLRRRLSLLATLAFACAPLLMFLYMSQFSRMFHDDYAYLGKVQELGLWQSILWWRGQWTGEYSMLLFYGLLTPAGIHAPARILFIIVAIGLPAIAWTTSRLAWFLGGWRLPIAAAGGLSALMLAAAFNSFHSVQNLFSLSAAIEYSLGVPILLLCTALTMEFAGRHQRGTSLALVALLALAIAFLTAGFSEMFMVFQTVCFLFLLAGLLLFRRDQRPAVLLCAAALLGSALSWIVQLTAPGNLYRIANPIEFMGSQPPDRSPLPLVVETLEVAVPRLGHPPAFAGFMLMLAAGLYTALKLRQPPAAPSARRPVLIPRWAPAFALCIQLLLLPLLWSHSSDSAQVFGRFSASFASVIFIHLASSMVLAALLMKRGWFCALLHRRNTALQICGIALFIICALFALTQLRSIHWKTELYLFLSALCWILLLLSPLGSAPGDSQAGKALLLALSGITGAGLSFAALTAVSLWASGFVYPRVYAPALYMLMFSGLLMGWALGICIRRVELQSESDSRWRRWYERASLLLALMLAAGITLGQAQRIPYLAEGAQNWDAIHQEILQLITTGDPAIDKVQYPYRTQNFMDEWLYSPDHQVIIDWRMRLYYGLEYSQDFGGKATTATAE